MANELHHSYTAGETIYALIRDSAGQVWDETNDVWVTWDTTDIATYKIAMTEIDDGDGGGLDYVGSFPTSITTQGRYFVQVCDASDDKAVAQGWINWTGSEEDFVPLRNRIR